LLNNIGSRPCTDSAQAFDVGYERNSLVGSQSVPIGPPPSRQIAPINKASFRLGRGRAAALTYSFRRMAHHIDHWLKLNLVSEVVTEWRGRELWVGFVCCGCGQIQGWHTLSSRSTREPAHGCPDWIFLAADPALDYARRQRADGSEGREVIVDSSPPARQR
jgi:hypothetical protein